jgi:hypothetical protein
MIKNSVYINFQEDKDTVKRLIEDNHYSHKMPQAIKYRFGLYYNGEIKGVAVFSVPANRFTITSIFENETQHIGIELSRFFTYDDTPKNFESYCLKRCFEYIKLNSDVDVIVSYADPNFNHAGYLYQALNGTYLGQTGSEIRYFYKGQLWTRRSLGRQKGDTEAEHAKRIMADGAVKVKMKGKYKYIFFTCNKKRKKELLNKLKENIVIHSKYPKIEAS